MSLQRELLLRQLASEIDSIEANHPLRVAVDGMDTAGKTIFAVELSDILQGTGRQVIRSTIDNFHNPRSLRYNRGRISPEGYYLDSFNYKSLITNLLIPLGPGGSKRYRRGYFDHLQDKPAVATEEEAPEGAILIFDGVFLHRPELIAYWDFSIFLRVSPYEVLKRALERDAERLGGRESVREIYLQRYLPAQAAYIEKDQPFVKASRVVDNEVPDDAYLVQIDQENMEDM